MAREAQPGLIPIAFAWKKEFTRSQCPIGSKLWLKLENEIDANILEISELDHGIFGHFVLGIDQSPGESVLVVLVTNELLR
ncbi:hypothetical protein MMC19_005996 [Ptychographa xylographoides]|nr:hypothetical protein [Ptychographa xylographoides]